MGFFIPGALSRAIMMRPFRALFYGPFIPGALPRAIIKRPFRAWMWGGCVFGMAYSVIYFLMTVRFLGGIFCDLFPDDGAVLCTDYIPIWLQAPTGRFYIAPGIARGIR